MKFEHLNSFRKVAYSGSFTRAAQELFITQPTVTQHIQSLETEFGAKLFHRSKTETRLTTEGKLLLDRIDAIFSLLDEAKNCFNQAQDEKGELSIGASTIMGSYYLPRFISQFVRRYPKINFSLLYGNSYTISDWLQSGVIDLGFAPYTPGFSRLEFSFVHREQCIFAAGPTSFLAKKDDLTLDDLCGLPFPLREKGTCHRSVIQKWVQRQTWKGEPPHILTFTDMDPIKKLVESGVGFTALPASALEREIEQGTLKRLPFDFKDVIIDYFLVRPQNSSPTWPARKFLNILMEGTGQNFLTG